MVAIPLAILGEINIILTLSKQDLRALRARENVVLDEAVARAWELVESEFETRPRKPVEPPNVLKMR
jgi:hypothetical protein